MKDASKGFTIIEVLIVLAVSGVMLLSSISLFTGRQQATEFTQAAYDLQSKFQSFAAEVGTSAVPGLNSNTCTAAASLDATGKIRPVLTTGAGSTSESCIYLGRVIQVVPGTDTIYAYPVFGLRNIYSGAVNTDDFPSTLDQSNPQPALDATGSYLLVDSYQLLNGLKVVSAKLAGGSTEQDYLSLYTNLQDSNTSGNEISATAKAITFTTTDVKGSNLKSCIQESSCGSGVSSSVNSSAWLLCVENYPGGRRAELSVKATATGLSTKLNVNACT